MLLPALSKAREKARCISCVNNIKSIATQIILYADSNGDFLPLAKRGGSENYQQRFWSAVIDGEMSNSTPATDMKSKSFTCPSDTVKNAKNSYAVPGATGLTNDWITYEDKVNGFDVQTRARSLVTVRNPSSAVYIADYKQTYNSPYYHRQWNANGGTSVWMIDVSDFRHGDAINVSYLDGHASTEKKVATVANVGCIASSYDKAALGWIVDEY